MQTRTIHTVKTCQYFAYCIHLKDVMDPLWHHGRGDRSQCRGYGPGGKGGGGREGAIIGVTILNMTDGH